MAKPIQEYVLCFAHPLPHVWWPEVLLIEKKKPAWQAGRFNLPGGHVEEGETCHEAARRELWEEAAIDCNLEDVKLMGTIEGEGWIVYVMHCAYDSLRGRNVVESITSERVFWMPVEEMFRDKRVLDNLRLIVPLVRSGLTGWTMLCEKGECNYVRTTQPKEASDANA